MTMTLEHAIALYAVMPAADKVRIPTLGYHVTEGCDCPDCKEDRLIFIAAVSRKADEIECAMLASEPTQGTIS